MTSKPAQHHTPPTVFSADHFDATECRRLRLALGLNAEKMALLARMPGRWAWLSVENGYEPIDPVIWVICLAQLDNRSDAGFAAFPTPRYGFDVPGLQDQNGRR